MSKAKRFFFKKAVILGGTGFIGTALAREIHITYPKVRIRSFSQKSLDLTDRSSVSQLSKLLDKDTLLLFCSGKMKRLGDSIDLLDDNLSMALNVSRAVQDSNVGKIVFFSSAAVYGEDIANKAITEATTPNATSYYGLSKYLSENILGRAISNDRLLVIRPPLVFGSGDTSVYTPTGFLRSIINDAEITLWGNGSELREYVFISDLCKVALGLANKNCHGVFNIATGEQESFRKVVNIASKLAGKPAKLKFRARTKRKADTLFRPGRLKKVFPKFRWVGIAEGLKRSILDGNIA